MSHAVWYVDTKASVMKKQDHLAVWVLLSHYTYILLEKSVFLCVGMVYMGVLEVSTAAIVTAMPQCYCT
jgi:hypothetical protein